VDNEPQGKLVPFAWNEQITAARLSSLSNDPIKRLQLILTAEYDLQEKFRDWLTKTAPQSLSAFDRSKQETSDAERDTVKRDFDRFLIEYAAERFGPRLFLCLPVMARLLRWNDEIDNTSGINNLQAFMDALLRGAKLRRGEGWGVFGPETKAGRKQLVSEFKLLKQKIKVSKSLKAKELKFEDVVSLIEAEPDTFPLAWKNLVSLREFYRFDKRKVDRFVSGLIAPAEFVSEWLAWTLGRNRKKLDNMLAKMKE